MTSILFYVVLFFIFTSIAIAFGTNMNYMALNRKGEIINYEAVQKLQFNILNSASQSTYLDQIGDKFVFSNQDEYVYDTQTKSILKNDILLLSNVEEFHLELKSERLYQIEIVVEKYGKTLQKNILFSVGESNE